MGWWMPIPGDGQFHYFDGESSLCGQHVAGSTYANPHNNDRLTRAEPSCEKCFALREAA